MHLDAACARVSFGPLAERRRKLHRSPVKQVNLPEKVGDPVPRLCVDSPKPLMLQVLDGSHHPLEHVPKRLDRTVGHRVAKTGDADVKIRPHGLEQRRLLGRFAQVSGTGAVGRMQKHQRSEMPLEVQLPDAMVVVGRLRPRGAVGQGTVPRQEVLKFRRVGRRPIERVQRRRNVRTHRYASRRNPQTQTISSSIFVEDTARIGSR